MLRDDAWSTGWNGNGQGKFESSGKLREKRGTKTERIGPFLDMTKNERPVDLAMELAKQFVSSEHFKK